MAVTIAETIALDGSGTATVTFSQSFAGFLTTVSLNKDGGTLNPTIVISELGSLGRTITNITETGSSASTYAIREAQVTPTNASTSTYANYFIESQLQVAVTGGDASGSVTIQFQYIPIQG